MKKKDILRGAVDGELLVVGAAVGAFVLLVLALVMAGQRDNKRWEQFKADHSCRVVAKRDSQSTSSGSYVAGQTGWLCDDGITYFRED